MHLGVSSRIHPWRKPRLFGFALSHCHGITRRNISAALCLVHYIDCGELLHSPSAADLKDGEAIDCLAALNRERLARCVGISCDDQTTLAGMAADRRVEVIEAPFGPNRQDLLVDLTRAADRGAIVIARE